MIRGARILVVEDEFLLAAMICDMIEDHGGVVVGHAACVQEALELLAAGEIDALVLDWNLAGNPGEPVAEAAARAGIPFVISTGYGSVTGAFADRPVLAKPYPGGALASALAGLLPAAKP